MGYYKKSFMKNLTKYLVTLVKNGDLVQHSDNHYALNSAKQKGLEQQLAYS